MELKRTRIASTILLLLLLLLLCLVLYTSATVRHGDEHGDREQEVAVVPRPSLWEVFRNGLSLYTCSPLKVASYRDKLKSITSQLHSYFFPPNLDFKVTSSSDEERRVDQLIGGGGAGEKMKDAMSKSFEKSKETVEDSAKSAAKAVGETVQKTKEKVKMSFSEKEGHHPHEPEL